MKTRDFLDLFIGSFRRNKDWNEQEFQEWARDQIAKDDRPISTTPAYFDYAQSLVGLTEVPGPGSNPKILGIIQEWMPGHGDDSTLSWCGAFVAHVMNKFGYRVAEQPLVARSWMHVYPRVDEIADTRPGDIVVLWRESPDSWKGHVGFFDHYDAANRDVHLLGGNQSNSVSVQAFDGNRVLGVYRPTA